MNPLPQIRLRAIEPDDLELIYRVENDVKLWNVGISNKPYSRFILEDYVLTASNDIYADRQVRMMVENEEGTTVGIVDLVSFDPSHRRAEIGVVTLEAHRQRGYAASALAQIADYALNVLHLRQLYAYIDKSNEASVALFRKAGYVQSGTLTDWLFDGRTYRDAWFVQRLL